MQDATAVDAHAVDNIWACPYCHHVLEIDTCNGCGRTYTRSGGQFDFRPSTPLELDVRWHYDPEFGAFPWDLVQVDWPDINNGVLLGDQDEIVERTILKCVPRGEGVALDIGCGESRQRFKDGLASLGYSPVGVDVSGSAPDALADAHVLPILDNSIDLVMTSAVWEHLKNPHRAMQEVARVAKPGALFIGAVAFGEPFHISYFHHSPLAVYELLQSAGFESDAFILNDRYSAFRAHLNMGYAGKRLPTLLKRLISDMVLVASIAPGALRGHRAAARRGFARSHAAAVGFLARKKVVTVAVEDGRAALVD